MDRAGGDGGSDRSSDSGSPPVVWECRLSLASSWDWSWYLSEAAAGQAGQLHVASEQVWLVRGSDAGWGAGEQEQTDARGCWRPLLDPQGTAGRPRWGPAGAWGPWNVSPELRTELAGVLCGSRAARVPWKGAWGPQS